jgi:plastocyanin
MKRLAVGIVLVLTFVVFNYAYAQSSIFEMRGAGVAVINGDNPKLYQSIFRMVLSDQSSVAKGFILVRGNDMQIHAKIMPQNWTFSYNKDGSFHGEGTVQAKSQIFNVTLDGARVFATNTGSMWKVIAIMEGDGKSLLLDYLVTGNDPLPAIAVSASENIIIPNGNSAMANTGFFVPLNLEAIRGTTVTWQNEDNIGHAIQSIDKDGNIIPLFNSGILKTGDTFTHQFMTPGIYHYYCSIHPWRIGLVTVS